MNKDQKGTRIEGVHYVCSYKAQPGSVVDIPSNAIYCVTLTRARAVAKLGKYGEIIIRPIDGNRGLIVAKVSGATNPTNLYYTGGSGNSNPIHGSKGPRGVRA